MPAPRFPRPAIAAGPSRRPLVLAGATALVALAAAAADGLADRITTFVPLGGTVPAEVRAPGDVATVGFLLQSGPAKKLSVLVKPAKKSALAPAVRLIAPDGAVLTTPGAKPAKFVLSDVPAGQGGLWRAEVSGATGTTGACTVQIKAKDVASVSGTQTVPASGQISVPIDVGSNQALTLTIRRGKGATITPRVRILDPEGLPLDNNAYLGVASTKTGILSLKAYRLPVFGRYTLQISGENGTGGAVSYTAKTAPAKPAKGAPVADTGVPQDAEPSTAAVLDATASRATGGGALAFRWSQVAGPDLDVTGADTATPSFVAPDESTTVAFELAVQERGVWSAPIPVAVEIGDRPLADAGRSFGVATAAAVTLDGAGSLDPRGGGLRYSWRQHPGDATQVTLTGADTAAPGFTAPASPAVLRFGLVVDDGSLRSKEDFVTVRVGDAGEPIADAGRPQVVGRMATVHLSALATRTASGVLDGPLTWTQVSGPTVTLDDPQSPFPAFTAPKTTADLEFQLSAGGATPATDTVRVLVRPAPGNLAPLTRANGTQFVASGNATLNATTSADPDADTLTYRWTQVAGAPLAPAAPTTGSTTVNVPAGNASRTYAVQANDGLAYGPPEFVAVRNTGYSGLPVANAGNDAIVQPGQAVSLDGRSSGRTQGSGPITYLWRQVAGSDWFDAESVPAFDATSATPSFTLPVDLSSLTARRTISFELVVNDGASDSAPDRVNVTFLNVPLNGKPIATAGASATNPVAGQIVTLQGSANDRDGDPVTVRWTQKSGPAVTLGSGGATALTPTFVAPASGTLVFELVANDGIESGPASQVSVVVDAAPTAVISISPTNGAPGAPVSVSALSSSDPEGAPLTYTWTETTSTVVNPPTNDSTGQWAFTAPSTSVTIRLVVNDGRQDSAPVTGTFTVGLPVTASPTASASNAPYGANVTLSAGAGGTGPFTYQWTQDTSGANSGDPAVSLNGVTNASPTFQAPVPTSANGFGASPGATFRVTVSNGQNQAVGTVRVTFFASFNNAASNQATTSNTVWSAMSGNCTSGGCHSGSSTTCSLSVGYGFGTASVFRTNNINVNACNGSKKRVDTTQGPNSSALIDRLKGVGGTQMPQGRSALSNSTIGLIADWIAQGGLDN